MSVLDTLLRIAGGRWFNKNTLESEYRAVGLVKLSDEQFAMMVSQNVAQARLVIYHGWANNTVLLKAVPGIAYVLYRWVGYHLAVAPGSCASGLYLTAVNNNNLLDLDGFSAVAPGDVRMFATDLSYQTPDNTAIVIGGDPANNHGYSVLYYNEVRTA